jgi:hypothetical protein
VAAQNSIFGSTAGVQTIYGGGLGANWKLNRTWSLTLSDNFTARTGQRNASYRENIVLLGIGMAL